MNESMLPQQELPTWAELKTMILAHSEQMRETERQMRATGEGVFSLTEPKERECF